MKYIWGLGFFYHLNQNEIDKLNIDGYIDNNLSKKMSKFKGKPLINSEQITSNMDVIIMCKNFVDIVYELIKKGVQNIQIGSYMFPESLQEKIIKKNGKYLICNGTLIYRTKNNEYKINNKKDISELYKKIHINEGYMNAFYDLPQEPFCREFGFSSGTPVDRVYIERFLMKYKEDIKGEVVEIAENSYTSKYGGSSVKNSYIMHVDNIGSNIIQGNLETGYGIKDNQYDCAIITQTLMFIYDYEAVVDNIYKMLKPGGVALITVAGISQLAREDSGKWGCYWSFQPDALIKGLKKKFNDNVWVESYGNVKIATAMLYGMCAEEIPNEIYDYNDMQYPVIIGARVKK